MNEPKVIQVIESHLKRGCGLAFCVAPHEHEALRYVTQYYSLSGELLAETDPITKESKRNADS